MGVGTRRYKDLDRGRAEPAVDEAMGLPRGLKRGGVSARPLLAS